jgi:hypothetical protein
MIEMFGIDQSTVAFGMLGIAAAASIRAFYYAYVALRAKKRVRELIRAHARDDMRLSEIIEKAAAERLSPAEMSEAISRIQATAVSLPRKDQEILDEGMHQHSTTGTKRFIRDVLAAA